MNKREFIAICTNYSIIIDKLRALNEVGIDLYESKYAISEDVDNLFLNTMKIHYNDLGMEWITWFVYENDFGLGELEATSDGQLICQDINELYNYVEQYKIIKDVTN